MKRIIFILLSFVCVEIQLYSQEIAPINSESTPAKKLMDIGFNFDFLEVTGNGYVSNNNTLPFWMHNNTYGRIDSNTNVMGLARAGISYNLTEESYFMLGGGIVAADDARDKVHRDELYVSFVNSWLNIVVGSKTQFKKYQDLSTVSQNFILAGNSRALPGLLIAASEPLKLSESFEIDWGIGHYMLNDDRIIKDTRVHYKKLALVFNLDNKSSFKFGVEHYAQWAGTSSQTGDLPNDFDAFVKVFFAKRASEDSPLGEALNSLGNHLGIYNFEYNFQPSAGIFSFYHQHPFEDGSGTALKNFPDGIWGFYFGPNTRDYDSFITGVLLEYIQTTDQSNSSNSGSSRDNYFSNTIYGSWTYHNDVIGLPFITTQGEFAAIQYNRTRGFHFGIAAKHKNWEYKIKTSLVENLGSFVDPIEPVEKAVYSYFTTTYNSKTLSGAFTLALGYDYSNRIDDTYGAGLSYKYNF